MGPFPTGRTPRPSPRPTDRRRAQGSLLGALGLLAFLAFLASLHFFMARTTLSEVQHGHLADLARLQAESACEELLFSFTRSMNEPGSKLFRALRENLDRPFSELDLGAWVDPPAIRVSPTYGPAEDPDLAEPVAIGTVHSHRIRILSPRPPEDPVAGEEWTALLQIDVLVTAEAQGLAVRRYRSAAHEIRVVVAAPPRPFDQVALWLGRVDAVVDPRLANQRRHQLLDEHGKTAEALARLADSATGATADRLRELSAAVHPRPELEARTPRLPEDTPAVLSGFHHVEEPRELRDLDLAAVLDRMAAERRELATRLAAAGPAEAEPIGYELLAQQGRALDRIWNYHWSQRILVEGTPEAMALAPWAARLSAPAFLSRVHLEMAPGSELLTRWKAGNAVLDGVVHVPAGEGSLELRGELQGRTVLVTGPAPVRLEDFGKPLSETSNRLVLVSLGAPVEVVGKAHAAIVMLGTPEGGPMGRIRIAPGATLVGSLLVPEPHPGSLALEGALFHDPGLRVPFPPSAALEERELGAYVFAVSPVPVFVEGGRS